MTSISFDEERVEECTHQEQRAGSEGATDDTIDHSIKYPHKDHSSPAASRPAR